MGDPKKLPVTTFLSPEGLFVLIAALVTSAVASLPIVVVPGILAYALLTFLRYQRWREAADDVLAPIVPPVEGLGQEYLAHVQRAAATQRQVLQEIASADQNTKLLLLPNAERVRELVVSTAQLARKLQQIEGHLRGANPSWLHEEATRLEARLKVTEDETARKGFERALEQQQEKVAVFAELKARSERILAQLTTVELTLETVAAQVVRIKSADSSAASEESLRVSEALRNLSIDVQALAESVEETEHAEFLSAGKHESAESLSAGKSQRSG